MKILGETLKQRRKELNLSIKEAENATSIRMTYLKSLEEGEIGKLISPVYAQGFFKQYAGFLGLDGERMIRDNPEVFNRSESQEFAYGIGTLEMRGNPSNKVKWIPNAVWVGAFVALIVLAWYAAKVLEVI